MTTEAIAIGVSIVAIITSVVMAVIMGLASANSSLRNGATKDQIASLKERLATTEGEVKILRQAVHDGEIKASTFQSDLGGVRETMGSIKESVGGLTREVSSMRRDLPHMLTVAASTAATTVLASIQTLGGGTQRTSESGSGRSVSIQAPTMFATGSSDTSPPQRR